MENKNRPGPQLGAPGAKMRWISLSRSNLKISRRSRAFTLLELVTVLVLLGVLVAMATATFSGVIGNSRTDVADASALEVSHSAVTIAAQTRTPASPATVTTSIRDIRGIVLSAYDETTSNLMLLYAVDTSKGVVTNVCVDIPETVNATPSICPLPTAVPGAPTNLEASADGDAASLIWSAPGTGGDLVTSYSVRYSSDDGATWSSAENSTSASSIVTSSLPSGTYVFEVAATNLVGQGPYSSVSSSVTINNSANIATPVPTVSQESASGSSASMAWTWVVPAGGNGSLTYHWSLFPSTSGCDSGTITTTGVTCTRDLTPDTSYTFSLYATDAAGHTSEVGTVTELSPNVPATTTTIAPTTTTTIAPTTTTTVAPTTTTTDPPLATPAPVVTENVTSSGVGSMAWDWTAVSGGTGTITYYWSLSPSATDCASGSTTTLSVACSGVMTPGLTYTFSLYAQDSEATTSSVGSVSADQMSTTTTTAPAPTTTTTQPNPSPAYPLYLLSTGGESCSAVLTMSGAAVIESQGGLAPIGVSSPCASSIALSGSAVLDASAIETADTALNSYCFAYHSGCSPTNVGPSERYHAATTDPFTTLSAPLNPGTQSAVSCTPNSVAITCPAGQYATTPTLNAKASGGVTFASGTTIFTNPVTISNNAVVTFAGGTVWFEGGLIVDGSGSVVFDEGTYIFGNSRGDTCTSSVCFETSNSGAVSTGSGGALFFVEAGAATLDGDSTTSIQGEATYDEVALWDAAASGSTNPITISNSGSITASFGGIYAPSGKVVLTGAGDTNALFVEAATATLSNSGTLSIGST